MANDSDNSKDIVISYQTIFDLFIREKNRQELQELSKTFYSDIINYLNEKIGLLNKKKQQNDVFSENEVEKLELQIRNIRKLLINLYEKRERKITMLALDKSRQSSLLVNTAAMLPEEKLFFDTLLNIFMSFRANVLANVLNSKKPDIGKIKESLNVSSASSASVGADGADDNGVKSNEEDSKDSKNGGKNALIHNPADKDNADKDIRNKGNEKQMKMIRLLNDIPRFLGKNAETYGPFHEDDITTLPSEIADILIKKGRAEEISERP